MSEVLGEHLGYLGLPRRGKLFSSALKKIINDGATVADLGCGVGVLGILALKQGAAHVWGIDSSDAIEIAKETMARAGLSDRYTCLRGSTFDTVLPQPVDVLVCDHVGFFGIDYGIVSLLADARRRLLKPGGQILPRRVRLVVAGVRSAQARGKAEAWKSSEIPEEYHWLSEMGINQKHPVNLTEEEICTRPAVLGEVDFAREDPRFLSFDSSLELIRDDSFDGIAGWFECELAEDVWMTNSPLSAESIGRSQAFFAIGKPFDAAAGETVKVEFQFRFDPLIISWSVQSAQLQSPQRHSIWSSTILTDKDLVTESSAVPSLTPAGQARRSLFGLIDGKLTIDEIEQRFIELHPSLLPTRTRMSEFVANELAKNTENR